MKSKKIVQLLVSVCVVGCAAVAFPQLPSLEQIVIQNNIQTPTPSATLTPRQILKKHFPYVVSTLRAQDDRLDATPAPSLKPIVVNVSAEMQARLDAALLADNNEVIFDNEDEYFGGDTPAPDTSVDVAPLPSVPAPPTAQPTAVPTPVPTPPPTLAPTPAPTQAPVETPSPTDVPLVSPAPSAPGSGDENATPAPTDAPVTPAPTDAPTPTQAPVATPAPTVPAATPEPTPTAAPTPTPIPVAGPVYTITASISTDHYRLYNAFANEYKQYTYEVAQHYGISYEMLLAIMYNESRFQPGVTHVNKNGTTDWGLMQINDVCFSFLSARVGITSMSDLLDPYVAIRAGADLLAYHMRNNGGDEDYALLCYQAGAAGAANYVASGVYPVVYTNVLANRALYRAANLT